jgi:hypothetical protein
MTNIVNGLGQIKVGVKPTPPPLEVMGFSQYTMLKTIQMML